jgi:hypothetical protein
LRIYRRGNLVWEDLQLGSGFKVELVYAKGVTVDGAAIGLTSDYDLTPSLARFLALNEDLIQERLKVVEAALDRYRARHLNESRDKARVLSYRFLKFVYDQPRDPNGLAESSIAFERDQRVRQLMVGSEAVFESAYERFSAVTRSEASVWWYLFWVSKFEDRFTDRFES